MAFSGTQKTRLGLYGASRGLYGSFAGKVAASGLSIPIAAFHYNHHLRSMVN